MPSACSDPKTRIPAYSSKANTVPGRSVNFPSFFIVIVSWTVTMPWFGPMVICSVMVDGSIEFCGCAGVWNGMSSGSFVDCMRESIEESASADTSAAAITIGKIAFIRIGYCYDTTILV